VKIVLGLAGGGLFMLAGLAGMGLGLVGNWKWNWNWKNVWMLVVVGGII